MLPPLRPIVRPVLGLVWLAALASSFAWLLAAQTGRAAAQVSSPVPVPAAPRGTRPRLFADGEPGRRLLANVSRAATEASRFSALCPRDLLASPRERWPQDILTRAGDGADTWPKLALACALAFRGTGSRDAVSTAVLLWRASLGDEQRLGDGRGCTADVDLEAWRTWRPGAQAAPPVIATIARDDGYPYRWYGPYLALVHDWLHDAPGVDAPLRAWSARCLTAWADFYSARGYHRDHPGSNYHAGFLLGKTLTAVALGGDTPAAARLWREVVEDEMGEQLVGRGLAANRREDAPIRSGATTRDQLRGNLRGGDWGEGWQYGPLSVVEIAAAARALEDLGVGWPALRAWTDDLALRSLHARAPNPAWQYPGGDTERATPWVPVARNQLNAVLVGPSRSAAAALAAKLGREARDAVGPYIWDALAEARAPDETAPPAPRAPWYFAWGTGALYARSSFQPGATWAVFASAPQIAADHHAHGASTFVFARGDDALIVDAAPYAQWATRFTNALDLVPGLEAPGGQTPESRAARPQVRATASGLVTATADITAAFDDRAPGGVRSQAGDRARGSAAVFATRDWAFLPEGFIVVLDQALSQDPHRRLVVRLHTGARGSLRFAGEIAEAQIGDTRLVIHPVLPDGSSRDGSSRDGSSRDGCSRELRTVADPKEARFPHDLYALALSPGQTAVAHVIEGLGPAASPAQVTRVAAPLFWGVTIARPDETVHVLSRRRGGGALSRARAGASSRGREAAPLAAATWHLTAAETPGRPTRFVLFDPPAGPGGTALVTRRTTGPGKGPASCEIEVRGARSATAASDAVLIAHAPAVFTLDEGCRPRDDGDLPADALP